MTKTFLLDSNIIIYTGIKDQYQLRDWLKLKDFVVSAISQLEVLGYHNLVSKDRKYFEDLFRQCDILTISPKIIDLAITFRQQKSMSLGDAIIAATSSVHKLPLVTANTKDFKHLEDLELVNPLDL